ncbi:MAG: cytochrome c [Nitrospirae bacterium]|nr:cytochrome c [Nitrospirota bacterium]
MQRTGFAMANNSRGLTRTLAWAGVLLTGSLLVGSWLTTAGTSWAASSPTQSTTTRGDAERGRTLFNGRGICFYCHGKDGHPDQRPQLSRETTEVIVRLAPNPPDLRDPRSLKLKNDRERFRAIREGHPGTGMLPDTTLTDDEIADTLAYLATLRASERNRR